MIITRQKKIDCILDLISEGPVFIVGCSKCATLCKTGGEEEVKKMRNNLEEKNIKVTGSIILDPACHLLNDKRLLKDCQDEINNAKKILVLACGNGVQTVAEIIDNAEVIPGTDTLFLGEIKRIGDFEKRCEMCGECIQDLFGSICPIARCPKAMMNGPCGGAINGKCEVSNDLDCVWDIIYKLLKERNQLDRLKIIQKPKDWSKSGEMKQVS